MQPAALTVTVEKVCENAPEVRTKVPSQTVVVSTAGAVPAVKTTDANGVATFAGLNTGSVKVRAQTPNGTLEQTKTLAAGANEAKFEVSVACAVVSGAAGSQP